MFGKRVLRGGIGKVVIYPSFFSNSVIILNQDFDMSKQDFYASFLFKFCFAFKQSEQF